MAVSRGAVFRSWIGVAALAAFGCGPSSNGASGDGGGGGSSGGNRDAGFVLTLDGQSASHDGGGGTGPTHVGGITRPCEGLECQQTSCLMGQCQQMSCPGGGKTTLSGRVYDPAGKVPLYNVVVYVPNAPLEPMTTGPSCDRCGSISGNPIATALTDAKGDFVLENIPVGANVPVVVQIGKWRRQVMVPRVTACTDNRVNDPNLLRLPRNQQEGHIPKIAVTTGGADKLECLLRKIGLADTEFTPEAGPGRVNFFSARGGSAAYASTLNNGARFTTARSFWDDPNGFKKYDMVILSCEGQQYPDDKSAAARRALQDYANAGGRVFASHWHNVWMELGPAPWPSVATFVKLPDLADPFTADVDATFPKAQALADWLVNVGASMTRGKLTINEAQHTVQSVNTMYSTRWIHSASTMPTSVQYFTFNTPAGAPAGQECGRVVFTDIHVSAQDTAGQPFPQGCKTRDLSAQEKALEFMLFDLSSCVQRDDRPPIIP